MCGSTREVPSRLRGKKDAMRALLWSRASDVDHVYRVIFSGDLKRALDDADDRGAHAWQVTVSWQVHVKAGCRRSCSLNAPRSPRNKRPRHRIVDSRQPFKISEDEDRLHDESPNNEIVVHIPYWARHEDWNVQILIIWHWRKNNWQKYLFSRYLVSQLTRAKARWFLDTRHEGD